MKLDNVLRMKLRGLGFITPTHFVTINQFLRSHDVSTCSRLTLDLDKVAGWQLYAVLARVRSGGYELSDLEQTEKGWHICALAPRPDPPDKLQLRLFMGDDPVRAGLDQRRPSWAREILFQEKRTVANPSSGKTRWRK